MRKISEELELNISRWGKSISKYLEYSNDRKILVYGEDSYTIAIAETVNAMKYEITAIISDTLIHKEFDVIPLNMLENYQSEDYFVLIATLTDHKKAYENMLLHNYKLQQDFAIMGIGGYTKPIDAIDSLLGFSRINDDIPGFKIWGNENEADYKIVILGNSTSDPTTGMLKSWSEMLYEKLANTKYKVKIYNGATTGYSSTQEFLKLNRDVLPIKPDLVISFSGYNDIDGTSCVENFPFLHKYTRKFYEYLKTHSRLAPDSMYMRNVQLVSHGNPIQLPDYMLWLNNMKKMHSICQTFSIKFVAYLQPMLECENIYLDSTLDTIINEFYQISDISRISVKEKNYEYYQNLREKIISYEFISDLYGIFSNQQNVFYDICHYTEKGNKIISEQIYKDVIKFLRKEDY